MLELTFRGPQTDHPYTDVEVWAEFIQGDRTVRRPLFWDGTREWRVRFHQPVEGEWTCRIAGPDASRFDPQPVAQERSEPNGTERLLRMSPKGRNAVWDDGSGFFLVADTAWALPYRATKEDAEAYAKDRQSKGFNAALLMVVQPDMRAVGPESRTEPEGFARGFDDLTEGRLTRIRPEYFQYLDDLVLILLRHGIVPIHTPLFYGFGWKGLEVSGPKVPVEDARRFARYLVARYGAWPAMWLVGADGTGLEPQVAAMGEEIQEWDAYSQPTGIHYNPWQEADAHWSDDWCDFQLCQTGHGGDHRPERVALMHARMPVRAVANGEPTYEGMGGGKHGNGEWQADEAWQNVSLGGTFGVFYGAASLWQWRLSADEPGWGDWCIGPFGWRQALELPGSKPPGMVARALEGMDWVDMEANIEISRGQRCVWAPGKFALMYLPNGGGCHFKPWAPDLPYRVMDVLTGEWIQSATLGSGDPWMGSFVDLPSGRPLAVAVGRAAG